LEQKLKQNKNGYIPKASWNMSVRVRITVIFTLLVAVILALACISVYYFSYNARVISIESKLTNRAITIGNLLDQSAFFSNELVRKIDSSSFLAYTNKVIQAYDYKNNKVYEYSDEPQSFITVAPELLKQARIKKKIFFKVGEREAVAYYHTDENSRVVMVAAGEDREGKQNLKNLLHILLLSYFGGLATACMGGYFFSKGLLRPIIKIADEVNHISTQSLSQRINTGNAKDEWHYLSQTLNSLLDRLMEGFNMQKRFIANASHELSTPLTSISSQLEVSLQKEREASEYRKVMKSVYQDVLHLSKLTRTLLEFAKASGTAGGIELAPVRIDEVLLRMPAEVSKRNYVCSVSFEFEDLPEDENNLLVYGNEELLFTAIKNIVINACKYSDEPPTIALATEGETIRIRVKDTGRGINQEELPHIFEPFYRASDVRMKDGFGLGLSMASRIIKLHNGEIKVHSEIGCGTTFTIRLPVAKDKQVLK
jgi:two-component system, OmpR family, sensor histidine kinase ArlS